PLLPRATRGMEVPLPAGRGVSRRTPGGNDRLQDAAGALGRGPGADGQEDPALGAAQQAALPREAGSLVSPDLKSQLSADDCALGAAAAGDDDPLLSGLVPDAVHRP